jgi:hypothetical protein
MGFILHQKFYTKKAKSFEGTSFGAKFLIYAKAAKGGVVPGSRPYCRNSLLFRTADGRETESVQNHIIRR